MTESRQDSQPELPTQFPQLQKTEGNFHYHLSIDKSVRQAAWWLVLIGILLVFMLGVLTPILYNVQREYRLMQQAEDERRLENRAAWKELGIDGNALEDHDISDIMKKVREKYPLEKPDEP